MMRLRGRTLLTIFLTIVLALLVIIYHFLGAEIDNDVAAAKMSFHNKNEDVHKNDFTGRPWRNVEKQKNIRQNDLQYDVKFGELENKNFGQVPADDAPLFQGHKIVHLDLKGAPFKITYYTYLLPLLKTLGATGILIEYEDMFPYTGEIRNISASNSYSKSDILNIQTIAKNNDLIVIPLIQSFGHFEFVLKLEQYKDLREVYNYPQVLCPSNNKTIHVLQNMIDQIIVAHPLLEYLHIGADEVYQIGECSKCMDVLMKKKWDKKQLFLDHILKITTYIKKKYPHVNILMWDDEFREINPREIINRGLNTLVEPIVWKYTTDPGSTLTEQLWKNYALIWKSVWIGTAFKGATVPDRYYTDISYHIENHQRWLEIITTYSEWIKFKGAILTGWQRYDHFSVLCELLPSSLPSLAINLAVLQSSDLGDFPIDVPANVLKKLQCDSSISLSIPEPQYAWTKCDYFGSLVYAATLRLFALNQEMSKMEQDNTYKGWMKPYNVKYAFSNPSHVEHATLDLDRYKMEVVYIEKEMRVAMNDIYDSYTIEEWIETFLAPLNDKVNLLWEAREKLLEKSSWPRRPLIKSDL